MPSGSLAIGSSATIAKAKYRADGAPEFDAADFKELEARARGPPILTEQESALVAEARALGNDKFKLGDVRGACAEYGRAIQVFADRPGGTREQRGEKSKLYANRAECLLRLESWHLAEEAAAMAVALDEGNIKARYRRARALEALGSEQHLDDAVVELGRIEASGKAEQHLLRRIHAARSELRGVRRRDADGLRRAFASGGLGLTAPADDVPAAPPASTSKQGELPTALHSAGMPRWLQLLSGRGAETRRLYLIDIYRTAVDDDFKATGTARGAHGIHAAGYSPVSLLMDFFIFCKLSRARGVLPQGCEWAWEPFLALAAPRLLRSFSPEVSQPANLYGDEAGTAHALRALVRTVYDDDDGSSGGRVGVGAGRPSTDLWLEWMQSVGYRDESGQDEDETDDAPTASGRPRPRRHLLTFDRDPAVFANVGGVDAWRLFLNQLNAETCKGGRKKGVRE